MEIAVDYSQISKPGCSLPRELHGNEPDDLHEIGNKINTLKWMRKAKEIKSPLSVTWS